MKLKQTPSQTVGPFFAFGLSAEQYGYSHNAIVSSTLTDAGTQGEHIRIEGRVIDGAGDPIPDAMIEIWQADSQGRYAHAEDKRGSNADFRGFGRCGTGTDEKNRFIFDTVKPGSAGGDDAPHINVIVFMRGLLTHAYTRIYFSDDNEANANDPVLQKVEEGRRKTLIAQRVETAGGIVYKLDIHMQGENETVFFDV